MQGNNILKITNKMDIKEIIDLLRKNKSNIIQIDPGKFNEVILISKILNIEIKEYYINYELEIKNRNDLLIEDSDSTIVMPITYAFWMTDKKINKIKSKVFFYEDNGKLYKKEEIILYKKEIKKTLDIIFLNYDIKKLSEPEKALIIFKYVSENYSYDNNLCQRKMNNKKNSFCEDDNGLSTLVTKKGVCTGISNAYIALLNNNIIKISATGVLGSFENIGHKWTRIIINKKPIDVCLTGKNFGENLSAKKYIQDDSMLCEQLFYKNFSSLYMLEERYKNSLENSIKCKKRKKIYKKNKGK